MSHTLDPREITKAISDDLHAAAAAELENPNPITHIMKQTHQIPHTIIDDLITAREHVAEYGQGTATLRPESSDKITALDESTLELVIDGQTFHLSVTEIDPRQVTEKITPRTITGTPDDWFDAATVLNAQQAAEREVGSWYITRTQHNGYNIAQATISNNASRTAALRSSIEAELDKTMRTQHSGDPDQPRRWPIEEADALREKITEKLKNQQAENVRRIIHVEHVLPDWMSADIITARASDDEGDLDRVMWQRRASSGRWHPIAQGQTSITDEAMAQRDPRTFSIVENTYLGE